jgi:hypothetical protein
MFEGFESVNEKTERWIMKDGVRADIGINRGNSGFSMISTKDALSLKNIPTKSSIKEI